ncbi:RNA-binding domain-containing protein [Proteiniborus sp.]|uniref:RNA-binding domain-containing protein n=1 Tax=Proteiniborus sp. TaxID=2079015 RepID=UPI003330A893
MLNLRETEKIEFKRELNESVKKELIAFANTDGGKIYIGIDDDGKVIGLSNAKQDLEAISSIIRDSIKPDLTLHTAIYIRTIEGKEILEIIVSKGTKQPYHLVSKGLKSSGVFVRHGITSAHATEEAIRQMIIESDGLSFEKARCINQELTFEYAKDVFNDKGVLIEKSQQRTLSIINDDGYYTNLGLLLSDQCEHSTKCAIYNGKTKLEFRDRKEFVGSVLKQLDDVYEYVNLYNKLETNFKGLNRIDRADYPYYAIREALINAVVHRDYNFSGSTLIHIFDDRIEFVSVGGLVSGLTMEDIMLGVSETRNKNLAACFYRLKLIESYGTGIQRIYESYSKYDLIPEIKVSENAFVMVLPNVNYKENLNTNEEKVLDIIKQKEPVARRDIELEIGLSKSSVNLILKKLIKEAKIKQEGKARNTRYSIK